MWTREVGAGARLQQGRGEPPGQDSALSRPSRLVVPELSCRPWHSEALVHLCLGRCPALPAPCRVDSLRLHNPPEQSGTLDIFGLIKAHRENPDPSLWGTK